MATLKSKKTAKALYALKKSGDCVVLYVGKPLWNIDPYHSKGGYWGSRGSQYCRSFCTAGFRAAFGTGALAKLKNNVPVEIRIAVEVTKNKLTK